LPEVADMKASEGVLCPLGIFCYFSGLFPNFHKTQKKEGGIKDELSKNYW
jgi:hypothetical protein